MSASADSLDDLLGAVFRRLLRSRERISPSRGPAKELIGCLLELRNPLARLSRTEERGNVFSGLGELLWYLKGSNKLSFIEHYISGYGDENSDDGVTVHGAYGPRLKTQMPHVLALLKKKDSRRAVVQLFDSKDISERHVEAPCTCTLQFFRRQDVLHLAAHMRSNDAYLGLPHDIFCFTMLQEIVARTLGLSLGKYIHLVGSLHLYDDSAAKARAYLDEGWQESIVMPSMPAENPWPSLRQVLTAEAALRRFGFFRQPLNQTDPYWRDIVHLLAFFSHFKARDERAMAAASKKVKAVVYRPFLARKARRLRAKPSDGKAEQQILL